MSGISKILDFVKLASWPSALPSAINSEDCCAIHSIIHCGDVNSVGCRRALYGTHPSIRVLYENGVKVCHADVGQRVIDKECAKGMWYLDPLFVSRARNRTGKVVRRFFGGFPVGVRVYGAGFCYLALFPEQIRSRLARILGPLPYLADVLRAYICFGKESVFFFLDDIGDGCLHVESSSESFGFMSIVRGALSYLEGNPETVIGGSEVVGSGFLAADGYFVKDESLHEADSDEEGNLRGRIKEAVEKSIVRTGGYERVVKHIGVQPVGVAGLYATTLIHWRNNKKWEAYRTSDESAALIGWFKENVSADFDFHTCDLLVLCSMPAAVLSVVLPDAKDVVRMLSLVGDSSLKLALASYAYSQMMTPRYHTVLMASVTNEALAVRLKVSGLRDLCAVEGLSEMSKANADILEAFIGVVAMHMAKRDLIKFLTCLNIVPDSFAFMDEVSAQACGPGELAGLTSQQHEAAVKLAALGWI